MREMQGQFGPAKGKDCDTGNVLGPWLVAADEIPDRYGVAMVARVNGEEWSRGSSAEMNHKFEDILVHASWRVLWVRHCRNWLRIGVGTVPKSGDVVELEVEGLGILPNLVIANP
jgi:2-keto-4-pentenoate hydratase/2-oxohepta-3-ene-1,7-dioic acid hydratase in catechol pathway